MKNKKAIADADDNLRRMLCPTEADLEVERELGGAEATYELLNARRLLNQKLPVLAPRSRGRPKGMTENTWELVLMLKERVAAGEKPTPAARDLLEKAGVQTGTIKGQAGHLVRALKSLK